LTSEHAKNLNVEKDISKVVDDFSRCILQADNKTIPKRAHKNYKSYWNSELEQLHNEVGTSLKQAETSLSHKDHNNHQHAKAKSQRAKLQSRWRSWKQKTESLNFETDTKKVCKLIKLLNYEGTERNTKIALKNNGNILMGKQAANCLADSYAEDNNIIVRSEKQRMTKEKHGVLSEIMEAPITLKELELAVSKLKMQKSPGHDGISNEMIKNLRNADRTKLLQIFNICWISGTVP
jgi:hypothetical protein